MDQEQSPQDANTNDDIHRTDANIATPNISADISDSTASNDNHTTDAVQNSSRERNHNGRYPSPFFRSLVQAADRIAQGPVLDLASSLRAEGDDFGDDSGTSRRGLHTGPDQGRRHEDRSSNTSNAPVFGTDHVRHRVSEPVTVEHSPSLPPLVRQSNTTAESSRQSHGNTGSSSLSDLLRQYQDEHESSSARTWTERYATSPSNGDHLQQRNQPSLFERSSEARRGLERALRDYRAARRALRVHNSENNETENGRREAMMGSTSWLREPNTLVDAVATLNDVNDPWQSSDGPRERVERTPTSSVVDQSTSSNVPTVAALRAARLSMQRSAGGSTNQISSGTTNDRSIISRPQDSLNNPQRPENSRRQLERTAALREISRHLTGQRGETAGASASPRTIANNGPNAAMRPSDLNADSRRRLDASLLRSRSRTMKTEETPSRKKAKTTVRYLTKLKQAAENGSCPVSLAQEMGIDSIKQSLENAVVYDLPYRMDELPKPVQSSWLECGVGWSGEQVSGNTRLPSPFLASVNTEIPIWAQSAAGRGDDTDRMLSLRARRHRERIRAERLEREQQLSSTGPNSGQSWSTFGLPPTGSIEILADMERHLSDLLEEEEQRLQPDDGWTMPDSLLGRQRTRLTSYAPKTVEDRWPVSVKLHAIDLDNMTVHGTMSASHIPNRSRSGLRNGSNQEEKTGDSQPIESFFDGEIIDFHHHEIETRENKEGYKCGGLAIDVQYWAGLGPFREEVERQKNVIRFEKQMEVECGGKDSESSRAVLECIKTGTRDTYESMVKSLKDCSMMEEFELDKEESDRAVDEAMIRCLGSKKWLDEKLGKEWILMRWKERFFVPTTSTSSGPSVQARSTSFPSTIYSSNDPSCWGLTISGFYYIAMHRQTGKIEGLYYDPGSQPFQRLEMWPIDSARKSNASQLQESTVLQSTSTTTTTTTTTGKSTNTLESFDRSLSIDYDDDIIGVRKWFPSNEFR